MDEGTSEVGADLVGKGGSGQVVSVGESGGSQVLSVGHSGGSNNLDLSGLDGLDHGGGDGGGGVGVHGGSGVNDGSGVHNGGGVIDGGSGVHDGDHGLADVVNETVLVVILGESLQAERPQTTLGGDEVTESSMGGARQGSGLLDGLDREDGAGRGSSEEGSSISNLCMKQKKFLQKVTPATE